MGADQSTSSWLETVYLPIFVCSHFKMFCSVFTMSIDYLLNRWKQWLEATYQSKDDPDGPLDADSRQITTAILSTFFLKQIIVGFRNENHSCLKQWCFYPYNYNTWPHLSLSPWRFGPLSLPLDCFDPDIVPHLHPFDLLVLDLRYGGHNNELLIFPPRLTFLSLPLDPSFIFVKMLLNFSLKERTLCSLSSILYPRLSFLFSFIFSSVYPHDNYHFLSCLSFSSSTSLYKFLFETSSLCLPLCIVGNLCPQLRHPPPPLSTMSNYMYASSVFLFLIKVTEHWERLKAVSLADSFSLFPKLWGGLSMAQETRGTWRSKRTWRNFTATNWTNFIEYACCNLRIFIQDQN